MTKKKIEGAVTKEINGKKRTFRLGMLALADLEDQFFEDPRLLRRREYRDRSEIVKLKSRVVQLEELLTKHKIAHPKYEAPNLFLGLFDSNSASNAEWVAVILSALQSHHPEMTREELLNEIETPANLAGYLEGVLEAFAVSQPDEVAEDIKKKIEEAKALSQESEEK